MSKKDKDVNIDELLDSVDERRRSVVKKVLAGGALFAAPQIASDLLSGEAHAQGKKGFGKGKKGKGKGKK